MFRGAVFSGHGVDAIKERACCDCWCRMWLNLVFCDKTTVISRLLVTNVTTSFVTFGIAFFLSFHVGRIQPARCMRTETR